MQLTERQRWKEIKIKKIVRYLRKKNKTIALNILYADEKEVQKKGEIETIPKINQTYISFGL